MNFGEVNFGAEVSAMRVTLHNARSGKNGVFSASHNDRTFKSKDEKVHREETSNNMYWCLGSTEMHKGAPLKDFDKVEHDAYVEYFSKALAAQNEKHRKAGNLNRIKSIDDYRKSPRTCPEETLLYIGNKDTHADVDIIQTISSEYLKWQAETYPNVLPLDAAIHVDEDGAPHIHLRQVWRAFDKNHNPVVSQTRALQELGIERPDTSKRESRYNNAKQTFTRMCREKLLEICRTHGLDVETNPRERSESGLSQAEYKARKETEHARQAQDAAQARLDELEQREKQIAEQNRALDARENALETREKALSARESDAYVFLYAPDDEKAVFEQRRQESFDESDRYNKRVGLLLARRGGLEQFRTHATNAEKKELVELIRDIPDQEKIDYLKQIDAALHREKPKTAPAWAWDAMPDETDYTQVKQQARQRSSAASNNKGFSR